MTDDELCEVCFDCGNVIPLGEVVWADPVTGRAVPKEEGKPFHLECVPEEPEDDE